MLSPSLRGKVNVYLSPKGSGWFLYLSFIALKLQSEPSQAALHDKDVGVIGRIAPNKRFGCGEKSTNQSETWNARDGVWGRCTATGQLRSRKTWEVWGIPVQSAVVGLCVAPGRTRFVYVTSATQINKLTLAHKSLRVCINMQKGRRALKLKEISPSMFS